MAIKQKSQVSKKEVSVLAQIEGADVVSIDEIELMPRAGGGGRGASPEVELLRSKARTLKIGQGFQIPVSLQVERKITSKNGESTLYTYKGAAAIAKLKEKEGKHFRTRRDKQGRMYIFRVSPPEEVQTEE